VEQHRAFAYPAHAEVVEVPRPLVERGAERFWVAGEV
jgi:hypothetical protein